MDLVKLLAPGPPRPGFVHIDDLTWKSVEGLTHRVLDIRGSILFTRCMVPDLKKTRPSGYVYPVNSSFYCPVRSSSYFDHELGLAVLQPVTCLWCATDQWRP